MVKKTRNRLARMSVFLLAAVLACVACSSSNTGSSSTDPDAQSQTQSQTQSQQQPNPDVSEQANPDLSGIEQADPESAAETNTDLNRLINGLIRATGNTLNQVNDKFSSGLPLSEPEGRCFSNYNPSTGQPAIAFDCDGQSIIVPGVTGNARIAMTNAYLRETASCVSAVQIGSIESCELEKAELQISTQWVTDGPQQRPYPLRGATYSYDADSGQLNFKSEENVAFQNFECSVDLSTGLPAADTTSADIEVCNAALIEMADRLDSLLAG